MARAKYTIKVQNKGKPSDTYETNDAAKAQEIVNREIDRANSVFSAAQAIFLNDSMRWRRRK